MKKPIKNYTYKDINTSGNPVLLLYIAVDKWPRTFH